MYQSVAYVAHSLQQPASHVVSDAHYYRVAFMQLHKAEGLLLLQQGKATSLLLTLFIAYIHA